LRFTRYGSLYGARGGNFGIGVKKEKRNIFLRIGFWLKRMKFKNLTIKELQQLPPAKQMEYLRKKYYLYGITPFLLEKIERTPTRADDPLNQALPSSEENNNN